MSLPLKIKTASCFKDKRGFLWTSWKKGSYSKINFNHDKFSISKKNTIRGFHCDFKSWKLATCVYGKIFLAVVDMRKNSKNYLKSKIVLLNHTKPKFVLIPPYYANAHLCLSKECVFHYKWFYKGKYVEAKNQYSFKWNDPKINIKWPIKKPILSKRDQNSKFI
jgi:dTDP-4-dehydrorhamnose 3,5-epimerase